ncbi:MAG: threonine--tRNA ligase [Gammaproteobacteria bacterium]|nr:MAG: threonine--tRNA ligase [Gammaproteobacteria bacterium]
MITITLPDGSTRKMQKGVTLADVAADIGPGLAKAAIAGTVNDVPRDLSDPIVEDANITLFTSRNEEGVDIIRHSCAHLFGHAVKQLYPETKMVIGPIIDNGFYYDIDSEHRFTPEDLQKIQKRMEALAATGYEVVKTMTPIAQARAQFAERGEVFKLRLIDEMDASVTEVGLYRHQEYLDMCRGPHVPNMSHCKAFQLTKLAGAYWRGDANNEQLQRIYGVAFADKKALRKHLHLMQEAEKRDHRKIGKKQDLFHLQEEAPGMVFWHPKGWSIYQRLAQYMREKQRLSGYLEVNTPQIVDKTLWEKSGHWDKYSDDMFTTNSEARQFAIKPMNCPCHVQIYNQGIKSYRDLPIRLAEFGSCHRNELSGALHGLMRVRGFVQDDGHIFCTPSQIQSESAAFIDFLHDVYRDFGFTDIIYRLSTRPEKRIGSDAVWDKSEKALADALNSKGVDWAELPGEGAFYGPKIEFSLKDTIGRVWQCGTLQVDFNMPTRLDATFVNEHGEREAPVMLHRATLGSFERFVGILIEHFAGDFPFWLAPIQATVLNISEKQNSYVLEVTKKLQAAGFSVNNDLRNEKIGYKIREHIGQRAPYLLVVGDKEMENGTVNVRKRGQKADLGTFTIDELIERFNRENHPGG